jgi:hypothetical protein
VRLSELLDREVVRADGRSLGKVRDVRLVQDGPILAGGTQAALRVDAVIVSRGWRGVRLGYLRGQVRGPWLLRATFGRLERGAHAISLRDLVWDDEESRLRLRTDEPDAQDGHAGP